MLRARPRSFICIAILVTGGYAQATGAGDLYLEVSINGAPTHLIAQFRHESDGSLSTPATELDAIGLRPVSEPDKDRWIPLRSIEGLTYTYRPEQQSLDIRVDDGLRGTVMYDASGRERDLPRLDQSYGAVLNYSAFFASPISSDWLKVLPQGGNVALDGRIFTPFGNLEQTGILGSTAARDGSVLRLDTTFVHSDPSTSRTYRAGDLISGSLPWTRSIRMGGVQVQSDFGLRPDLVTAALPSLSGSAAVPSTAEVLVGGTRVYSTDVAAGPFQITNLPAAAGSSDARLVIRDVTGREVETTVPLYDTSRLLRPGLFSFSAELGRPRLFYGLESNSYGADIVGSASVRYGLSPLLTLEGHAEGGAELINGGLGATTVLGRWGTLALAASGSRYGESIGGQVYGSFETRWRDLTLHVSSQRTFGEFHDLASVTAPTLGAVDLRSGAGLFLSSRTPEALDQISLSTPGYIGGSSLSFSALNVVDSKHDTRQLLTASYTQRVGTGHIFATVLVEPRQGHAGLYAGLSLPLGWGGYASGGASFDNGRLALTVDASKPIGVEPGSVGWRARGTGNRQNSAFDVANYSGAVSYRTAFMQVEAGAEKAGPGLRGTLLAEGAVAVTSEGVFASNRINDSFAVVNVGVPGVPVLLENNVVAQTDFRGKVLLPDLPSYEARKISIDASALPLDADVRETTQTVRPARRSGATIDLSVRSDVQSALLELVYPDGRHVEPGAQGRVEGGEPFIVGYDGQALIRGVHQTNRVFVQIQDRTCTAVFENMPTESAFGQVGRTVCK